MRIVFLGLVLIGSMAVLTGCETTKYAVDQTLSEQREFGPNSRETAKAPDNMLAQADQWVRRNLW